MKTVAFVRASNIYDDSRASKEIRALLDTGYKILILGWNRDGRALEKTKTLFENANVEVSFYDCSAKNGIGIRNISKLLKFIIWVYKTLKQLRPDCVHACDLDAGIGSFLYCKIMKKAMVYDIFDYYVDSRNMPVILQFFVERLEVTIINFANATIICTEERKIQISKAHPQKMIVLHNSPDVSEVVPEKIEFDYAYCGALLSKRLLGEILNKYENYSELNFCFAGYGEYASLSEENDSRFPNFSYRGAVPYAEVLDIERKSRCLAAIYEPTIRNHRLCAPNKFYEALALAKPIIVCRGTGIDKIVQENELGFVIDYDVDQFYEAVKMVKENPEMAEKMGQKARTIYEQKYKWTVMKQRLIDLYEDIA